jgi:hypothetical protein
LDGSRETDADSGSLMHSNIYGCLNRPSPRGTG